MACRIPYRVVRQVYNGSLYVYVSWSFLCTEGRSLRRPMKDLITRSSGSSVFHHVAFSSPCYYISSISEKQMLYHEATSTLSSFLDPK
jgi:hypothetical protein